MLFVGKNAHIPAPLPLLLTDNRARISLAKWPMAGNSSAPRTDAPGWRNWQTRMVEGHVSAMRCEFESRPGQLLTTGQPSRSSDVNYRQKRRLARTLIATLAFTHTSLSIPCCSRFLRPMGGLTKQNRDPSKRLIPVCCFVGSVGP